MSKAIKTLERILSRSRRKSNGCLVCYLGLNHDEYSTIQLEKRGKRYRTSRMIMHLVRGFDLDSPMLILHNNSCISKACIEFNHLREGTESDNKHDYWKKRKGN